MTDEEAVQLINQAKDFPKAQITAAGYDLNEVTEKIRQRQAAMEDSTGAS